MITKLISLLKNIVCFELTISFKPVVVRCLFVDCWVYLTFLLCSCAAIMFVSGLLLPGFKLMAWEFQNFWLGFGMRSLCTYMAGGSPNGQKLAKTGLKNLF